MTPRTSPSTTTRPYHHGSLRQALIDAGIAILDSDGIGALSLRECAARTGVSHAAPSHHFGNLEGLTTALGTEAYRRFVSATAAEQAASDPDPIGRLIAAGRGYLRFATGHSGLFRLMFNASKLDHTDPDLRDACRAAYDQLGDTVRPFQADDSEAESERLRLLVWSTIHGYAHLLLEGQLAHHGVSADGLSHMPDLAALVAPPT